MARKTRQITLPIPDWHTLDQMARALGCRPAGGPNKLASATTLLRMIARGFIDCVPTGPLHAEDAYREAWRAELAKTAQRAEEVREARKAVDGRRTGAK